ncbi:MAG: hypothetical protein ABIL01_15245 [Pseudomonadota bacterium]
MQRSPSTSACSWPPHCSTPRTCTCRLPTSTIDLSIPNGDAIPIEERTPRAVDHVGKERITPDGVEVANPAFDVTPAKYITAIITKHGVAYPLYAKSLAEIMEQARAHRAAQKVTT